MSTPTAITLAIEILREDMRALVDCHAHPETGVIPPDEPEARAAYERYCAAINGLEALAAPVEKAAPGQPMRSDYVKAARIIALGYGRQDDAPSYLPRTEEAAATFEPHGWVIAAMMQAYSDGVADGHAEGRTFQSAQQAAQPVATVKDGLTVAQPVAEVGDLIIQVRERVMAAGARNRDPLYTAAPSLSPLTLERKEDLWQDYWPWGAGYGKKDWYLKGIEDAERAHGIKAGKAEHPGGGK